MLWVAGARGVRVMLRARELEPRHEEEQSQRLLTVGAEHARARSALSLVPVRVVDATALCLCGLRGASVLPVSYKTAQ